MATVTLSCRGKTSQISLADWFQVYKDYAPLEVTGVFGFMEEFSPLYGGRQYIGAEITEEDFKFMLASGLKLKIPLTAHKVSEKEYEESRELLNKYYYPGNSIAIVNDDLAKWIKRDYPNYLIEASVIKNVNWKDIDTTLELYDTVVLSMDKNDDHENLKKIKQKDKIVLFGNAGCAYTCPSKICYPSVSKVNKGEQEEMKCSMNLKPREKNYVHNFDLEELRGLGFNNFKFVTVHTGSGF